MVNLLMVEDEERVASFVGKDSAPTGTPSSG